MSTFAIPTLVRRVHLLDIQLELVSAVMRRQTPGQR